MPQQPAHVAEFDAGTRLRVGFVCFGRTTFDLRTADQMVQASKQALQQHDVEWFMEDKLLTQVPAAEEAANRMAGRIDLLVAQFTTFVDARYIDVMGTRLQTPVILWAIREPNRLPGQRLSLNSLTGANLAAQRLYKRNIPFQVIYGGPEEHQLTSQLEQAFRYWRAFAHLRRFTVVTLGQAPDGFFFSTPASAVQERLGIRNIHIDLNGAFQRAELVSNETAQGVLDDIRSKVRGVERLPETSVVKFAKLMVVLRDDLQRFQANAIAVRCWPEFFTEFGAAACSTLSALTDMGIMGACEADVLGALSMDVLHQLTASPAYLGDLVEIDEEQQAVVFWHCGAGAFSLARPDTGAIAGKHPNRQIGFTLEFGLKPGKVTILRIGEDRNGVRALVGLGEVVDEPQRFQGTSGKVRLCGDGDVKERVIRVMELGFEPHYALAYGDVVAQLERLFCTLEIPVTRF
ncbi:hypothetical protein [Alicyclobacillus macrosporangiidus]|uniref:hypothetical protein n=1 Tax=Alicyclobacillus macrosporangiidus TaxID=392015 RepID=UPI00068A1743|nr:hypothetical protein [Alicyclobacillus macrosporangiidus]